jgi:hypothetical protein
MLQLLKACMCLVKVCVCIAAAALGLQGLQYGSCACLQYILDNVMPLVLILLLQGPEELPQQPLGCA